MRVFAWLSKFNQPQYQYLLEVDKLEPGGSILWWHDPELKYWYQYKRLVAGLICHHPDHRELAVASATFRSMLFGGWRNFP